MLIVVVFMYKFEGEYKYLFYNIDNFNLLLLIKYLGI